MISPYNEFKNWDKFKRYILDAKERKVKINFYSRENERTDSFYSLDIQPHLIKNLHGKLYFNESYAILTSMNLVEGSDKKSIDFGTMTTTKKEYDEIISYFSSYIKPKTNNFDLTEFQKEIPVLTYFNNSDDYELNSMKLHKLYYSKSSIIKEFGLKKNGKKHGEWHYFNENGVLNRIERHFDNYEYSNIDFKYRAGKYQILFTLGNIIGSLYNCSIQDFYFNSNLNEFIKDAPEKLYDYLENTLKKRGLCRDCITVQNLVDSMFYTACWTD